MKIKAPFVVQSTRPNADDWRFVQAGYTVRQFVQHWRFKGRRRVFCNWWVWGYVQSEGRLLNDKELAL